MQSQNIRYMPELDHIRGFAAFMILFYHGLHVFSYQLRFNQPFNFTHWIETDNPLMALLAEAHISLALFMVLSGFLLAYGSTGKDIKYRTFLYNRVLRIYPLMMLFLVAGICAFPKQFDFQSFIQTIVMMGNINGRLDIWPFTAMFWAIAVEFQFYLLFPLLMLLLNRNGMKIILALLVLMLLLRFIGVMHGASPRDMSYWTLLGRADQFLLGMLAGNALASGKQIKHPIYLVFGLLGFISLAFWFNHQGGWPVDEVWRIFIPLVEAIICVSFILGYCAVVKWLPTRLCQVFKSLGMLSFSVYLWHYVVISTIQKGQWWLVITNDPYYDALMTTILLVLPVSLMLSTLTWHAIEKPFLGMRRRYIAAS